MAKTYILGNWKMNQSIKNIEDFFNDINIPKSDDSSFFGIAPQAIHFSICKDLANDLNIGAQNVSQYESGAHTGEISPVNLKEMDCDFVIIGHSERRALYKETDHNINEKVKLSLAHNLLPVICIGETLEEREAGKEVQVVTYQLVNALKNIEINNTDQIVIAYEPVWAIGTGKSATSDQAQAIHKEISNKLEVLYPGIGSKISILYGGSVKPSNISELLEKENINGALVGGASLKASDYTSLCTATK